MEPLADAAARGVSEGDDEARPGYAGWRVAAAAGVGVFCAALVVVTFPVLLAPLAHEFTWSRRTVATAFGVAALVAAACGAPVGVLLDRVGPRRVVVPSLAVFGCAFASLAWLTPNTWHLYATFAVLGASAIGTSPVAYARAIATWFVRRRGLALAIAITGAPIGGMSIPPLMEALSRAVGWRGACFALGAGVLVVGVPIAASFVREHPTRRERRADTSGATLREGVATRTFWLLAVGMFGGTLVQNGVLVHLSALLTDRGISPAHAALALSAMALSAVAGRVATGFAIDRLDAARVGFVLLSIAALGAWSLARADTLTLAIVAAALVGFGTGGESDVVPYLVSRRFGLRAFSALYGAAWMAGGVGGALGPVLMGRAFDERGSYDGVLVLLASVAAVAALAMLALSRFSASRP